MTPRFREAERVSVTYSWEQGCQPPYHDRWLGARRPRDSASGAMRRAMKPVPKSRASRRRRYGREGVRPRLRRSSGSLLYQAPQPSEIQGDEYASPAKVAQTKEGQLRNALARGPRL